MGGNQCPYSGCPGSLAGLENGASWSPLWRNHTVGFHSPSWHSDETPPLPRFWRLCPRAALQGQLWGVQHGGHGKTRSDVPMWSPPWRAGLHPPPPSGPTSACQTRPWAEPGGPRGESDSWGACNFLGSVLLQKNLKWWMDQRYSSWMAQCGSSVLQLSVI